MMHHWVDLVLAMAMLMPGLKTVWFAPPNGYVLEDGLTPYVAEDGSTPYVQES